MSYNNWSALDMALVLELSLQKDGNKHENVRLALTNLSDKSKVWKRGDEALPQYCQSLLHLPDPVKATRDVVNNFYQLLMEDDVFVSEKVEAELSEQEVAELTNAFGNLVANDMNQRLRDIGTGKIPLDQVHVC